MSCQAVMKINQLQLKNPWNHQGLWVVILIFQLERADVIMNNRNNLIQDCSSAFRSDDSHQVADGTAALPLCLAHIHPDTATKVERV